MEKLNKITAFVAPASLIALGAILIAKQLETQKLEERTDYLIELNDPELQEVKTEG